MKKLKRAAALALAAAMLLCFAACGEDTPGAQETETPDFVYVASYSPVELDVQYINRSCYFNGRIYFTAEYVDGQYTEKYPTYDENGNPVYDENGEPVMEEYTYDNYVTGLYSMADDGTDARLLQNYTGAEIPAGYEGSSYVNSMFAAGDSLYILESANYYGYMNSEGQMVDYMGNPIAVSDPKVPEESGSDGGSSSSSSEMAAAVPDVAAVPSTSSSDIIVNPNGEELYQLYEDHTLLNRLDAEGNVLSTIDLNSLGEGQEYFYINGATADGEGNIVCYDSNGNIYVLDSEGAQLFTLDAREENENIWIQGVFALRDGSVAVMLNWYDEANQTSVDEIRTIDMAAKALGEAVDAPARNGSILPGGGEYDYYMDNGTTLYGCKVGSAEAEGIVTWINCDVDGTSLDAVTPLDDGRIIAISNDYSGPEPEVSFVTLTETPSSEVPQKTVITYACMYLDYQVRAQILDFNRTNSTYRIEVRDYSEYNTNEDYDAGYTRLTTDIISGNAPDLIATDNLPVGRLSGKGLFEDLWPYIDADEELGGRSGVLESFFNAISQDGKLYTLYPSFNIITFEGPTAVFGEESGISFDELRAAMQQYPEAEVMENYTRSDMLNVVGQFALESFIDWETGTCSFDQGFADVLEFCNLFPEDYPDYEGGYVYVDPLLKMSRGELLLNPTYLYGFDAYYRAGDAVVEGGTTLVGIPGVGGSGGAFNCNTGIAMSTTCKDKDGAWQFMRRYIAGGFSDYVSGFSTNAKEFDQALEEAMTPVYTTDENGNQVEQPQTEYWVDSENIYPIYAMTQEEADEYMDIIANTTATVANADEQLMAIISEEAEAFFNGQRTAEDAAAMIQSRASIYVSEQS